MSGSILTLNQKTFKETIQNPDGAVLVDFWAPWCGPCRMLGPVLEDIAAHPPEGIKVGKVNVDDEPAIAQTYGIQSIPSMILFKDGKPVRQLVGAHPKERILEFLS